MFQFRRKKHKIERKTLTNSVAPPQLTPSPRQSPATNVRTLSLVSFTWDIAVLFLVLFRLKVNPTPFTRMRPPNGMTFEDTKHQSKWTHRRQRKKNYSMIYICFFEVRWNERESKPVWEMENSKDKGKSAPAAAEHSSRLPFLKWKRFSDSISFFLNCSVSRALKLIAKRKEIILLHGGCWTLDTDKMAFPPSHAFTSPIAGYICYFPSD